MDRFISFLGLIILLKREQSGNETLDIVYPFFKLRKASVSKRGHIKNPYLKMILTQDHVPTILFKDEADKNSLETKLFDLFCVRCDKLADLLSLICSPVKFILCPFCCGLQ